MDSRREERGSVPKRPGLSFGKYPPQHPVFGLSHANITDRLTPENWTRRAIVRRAGDRSLYIFISDFKYRYGDGTWETRYEVEGAKEYSREFSSLEEALGYANGEDGGALAVSSRPATPDEYPPEEDAEWTISILRR